MLIISFFNLKLQNKLKISESALKAKQGKITLWDKLKYLYVES